MNLLTIAVTEQIYLDTFETHVLSSADLRYFTTQHNVLHGQNHVIHRIVTFLQFSCEVDNLYPDRLTMSNTPFTMYVKTDTTFLLRKLQIYVLQKGWSSRSLYQSIDIWDFQEVARVNDECRRHHHHLWKMQLTREARTNFGSHRVIVLLEILIHSQNCQQWSYLDIDYARTYQLRFDNIDKSSNQDSDTTRSMTHYLLWY